MSSTERATTIAGLTIAIALIQLHGNVVNDHVKARLVTTAQGLLVHADMAKLSPGILSRIDPAKITMGPALTTLEKVITSVVCISETNG